MNDPNLPTFRTIRAPSSLTRSVERAGVSLLEEEQRVQRSPRTMIVNFGLTAYCVVQLLMCAHTVGLLP